MCPTVENLDLVLQETGDPQGLTHSRPPEYGSRQTIQPRPDHLDRVVSPSRGLPADMQQVTPVSDLFATRFNNKLDQFVSLVPDPLAWVVNALSHVLGGSGCIFAPVAILGKVVTMLQN